ncbi:hypothetical protein FQN54_000733 [Arachnomyces sp. PD_36]|nr:hypothetical protein FQN54_000733 [Arachnomyces sp. PD_36]
MKNSFDMVEQPPAFKVIIIGGSIVGLTLAHCLDRAGIDYVLLEKHQDICPGLGAILGIMPNGARILDQLGIYDAVKDVGEAINISHTVYSDGFSFSDPWASQMGEKLGYKLLVLTRQQLLSVLYNSLRDKAKVRAQKRVVKIYHEQSAVCVMTKDGDVYRGDLVVGADGVHSITRSELWRIAKTEQPGMIMSQETSALSSKYSVTFGLSASVPGIKPGEQITRFHENMSILVFGAKFGLLGWAIIRTLDRKHIYPNAPRFGQDDAIANGEALRDLHILRGVKFGDIWDRRTTLSMTALDEGILRTWNYGRVVCIGDSTNKMSPNMAQGANIGIESAAALANILHQLVMPRRPGHRKPSNSEVSNALDSLTLRYLRRWKAVNRISQFVTRRQTDGSLINRLARRYFLPNVVGMYLYTIVKMVDGSAKLDTWNMDMDMDMVGGDDSQGGLLGSPEVSWISSYTGVPAVDEAVRVVVMLFWPPISGNFPVMSLHFVTLLSGLLSVWLLLVLEACRIRPLAQILPRMIIVGSLMPLLGAGAVFPFCVGLNLHLPDAPAYKGNEDSHSGKGPRQPDHCHHSGSSGVTPRFNGLGVSSALGYILAVTPMFLPAPTIVSFEFKQLAVIGFLFGWLVCIMCLMWVMSLFRKHRKHGIVNRLDTATSHPRSIYAISFAFSAIPTISFIGYSAASSMGFFSVGYSKDSSLGWRNVFYPTFPWSTPTSAVGAAYLFSQWEYILFSISVLTWSSGLYLQEYHRAKLSINYLWFILKLLGLSIISGPPGAATVLIWEKNEILDKIPAEFKDD